jgi:hypothetical protein
MQTICSRAQHRKSYAIVTITADRNGFLEEGTLNNQLSTNCQFFLHPSYFLLSYCGSSARQKMPVSISALTERIVENIVTSLAH